MAQVKDNLGDRGLAQGTFQYDPIGTVYANLLISHDGQGIITGYGFSGGGASIEIDTLARGTAISGIRLDAKFDQGYRVYGNVPGIAATISHLNNDQTAEVNAVNATPATLGPLQVSESGVGVIKVFTANTQSRLVVDGITIYDRTSTGLSLSVEIPYFQSFEYYSSGGTISYDKVA